MARKKLSEMTPIERVDRALNGTTWDEAEQAGIEILARCFALHIYARKEGAEYMNDIMKRICERGDEWAHEPGNTGRLAFAAVAHERKDLLTMH